MDVRQRTVFAVVEKKATMKLTIGLHCKRGQAYSGTTDKPVPISKEDPTTCDRNFMFSVATTKCNPKTTTTTTPTTTTTTATTRTTHTYTENPYTTTTTTTSSTTTSSTSTTTGCDVKKCFHLSE